MAVAGVANLLSQSLVSMRHFVLQFWINVAMLAASVVASVILIPGRGLQGGLLALGAVTGVRLLVYASTIGALCRREP